MNRAQRRREQRRSASRAGSDRPTRWLAPVLIAVVGLAAYVSGLNGGFVFDDIGHIVDTTRIRDLWHSFSGQRPVVNFTLGINYAIGALDPGGYHVFNVVVHILAGITLFGVLRRTFAQLEPPGRLAEASPWFALTVALLWVVHPLQTQSVTYVIQRGESLMGLFYLLTLYTFIRGATSARGRPWFLGSVVACGLGMGCKEVMVTAPFMVLLYDALFLGGSIGRALRRRWPVHLGLFATWGVLGLVGILSIFDPDSGRNVGFGAEGMTWLEYGRTQPEVILHYITLAVWPHHLCLDYMWPVQESWAVFAAGASVLSVLAIATLVLVVKGRPSGYIGAWFFVILAPTSSFVPVRDLAFEHRMYLPLAALIVLAVIGTDAILRLGARRAGLSENAGRIVAGVLLGGVTAMFVVRTAVRNRDYATPLRMWQTVADLRPENDRALQNIGSAHLVAGRIDEAEPYCLRAIEINPRNANALINLGTISMQRGAAGEAVARYEAAIRADPESPIAHNNLGSLYAQRGDMTRAHELYVMAVRLEPTYVQARFSLGRVLELRGDREGALREYLVVLELDASHKRARERVAALSR